MFPLGGIRNYFMGFIADIDRPLFGAALFLILASLVTLFSVDLDLFYKQLIWVSASIALMAFLSTLNLKSFFSYRWAVLGFYLAVLVLLVMVFFFAPRIANIRSWLVIGGFQFQPSEFMKLALIILFSSFFALKHIAIRRFGIIFASFIYFFIPAALVLAQPDLGTAIILSGIWFGYLLISEIPFRYVAMLFLLLAVIAGFAWNFGLQGYQKERIIALFNPEYDPLGVNYNVIQSKIAIGSAGLFGKGFQQGTEVQLGYLPNAGTDFAFSAFTEEWGILGGLVIISVFAFLSFRILILGMQSDNNFSKFVCLGGVIMLLMHFIVNLGSVLGLFPVVGVSFPLLSYGGSNLLTVMALLGIIQNIAKRRAGF